MRLSWVALHKMFSSHLHSHSQKAIATDFILDPFHDWIDGSDCTSNEGCRALECCSMGNIERAAQAARFDVVEVRFWFHMHDNIAPFLSLKIMTCLYKLQGEPKSVCRVKDVYIYVFFTLCLFVILGFIVCCGCIICIRYVQMIGIYAMQDMRIWDDKILIYFRRSAVATATDFKMRENPHNSRNVPSMLPPAPE